MKATIHRPDGTRIEAEGTPEEIRTLLEPRFSQAFSLPTVPSGFPLPSVPTPLPDPYAPSTTSPNPQWYGIRITGQDMGDVSTEGFRTGGYLAQLEKLEKSCK